MSTHRQLAAIMFTDIVGYTALMGRDEKRAFDILKINREIQKPLIERYHGKWIKELGDGVMASFHTVTDAVNAAIEIQENCVTKNEFQLRIGIHLGEVVFENEDAFGDGVNIASRIQALASPGTIYVSESVHQNVSNKQGIHSRFVKQTQLKNVKDAVNIFEILLGPSESSYQTSSDVKDKKEIKGKSIAVLPFTNMSSDPDQEYFTDGISEDIITHLTKLNGIKVISRTSAFHYKHTEKKLQEIASELNVTFIVHGSVRKSGNKIRINTQLLQANNDDHLWAEIYDRDLTDVFEVQSDIALRISLAIKGRLTDSEEKRLHEKPTEVIEAYNLYLLGKFHYNKATPEDRNLAAEYLQKAIALDPDFALAYATLAAVIMFQGVGYFGIRPHDVMPEAFEMANKALAIDPGLSYAYLVRGEIYDWYFFDWEKAKADYKRAIFLSPNNADAHLYYAIHLVAHKKFDEAIREKQLAADHDPYSLLIRTDGFWIMNAAGQTEQAFQEVYEYFVLSNDQVNSNFYKALYLTAVSKPLEAVKNWEQVHSLTKGSRFENFFKIFCAYGYAMAKMSNEARNLMAEIHQLEASEFIWPMGIAIVYANLGDTSKALDYLEKAYEERTGWMLWIGCDPFLNNLRTEPRFKELVRKIGPPEAIADIARSEL